MRTWRYRLLIVFAGLALLMVGGCLDIDVGPDEEASLSPDRPGLAAADEGPDSPADRR